MSSLPETLDEASALSDANTEGSGKDANVADVRSAVVKQVEFYFSDANLPTDKFLLKQVQQGQQGFVPIKLIAQFKRVKSLSKDLQLITEALKDSAELVVSPDQLYVRRLKPLPNVNEHDIKRRTVIVTNLPGVPSIESVTEQFSRYGPVKLVRICPPGSTEKLPQWLTVANPSVQAAAASNQLFALVEFATEDASSKAVGDRRISSDGGGIQVRHLLPNAPQRGNYQQQQQVGQRGMQGNPNARRNQPQGRGPGPHGGSPVDQLRQDMNRMHLDHPTSAPYDISGPGRGGHPHGRGGGPNNGPQQQRGVVAAGRNGPRAPYSNDVRSNDVRTFDGGYENGGAAGSRQRSVSAQPTQRQVVMVRSRGEQPAAGSAAPEAGAGAGPPEDSGRAVEQSANRVRDRPVSVGRRAPHFVVDLDYQPAEGNRRAPSRRQRGRNGADWPETIGEHDGDGPSTSTQPERRQLQQQPQQQQQQQQGRGRNGRQQANTASGRHSQGQVPADGSSPGGPSPGNLQVMAERMQGLQSQAGGEKDLRQFIALFESFVQQQIGGQQDGVRPLAGSAAEAGMLQAAAAAAVAGASTSGSAAAAAAMASINTSGGGSPLANGAQGTRAPNNTPNGTPSNTPGKQGKKGRNKGGRGGDQHPGTGTPDQGKMGTPPGAGGVFVFGEHGGDGHHNNTPVGKVASHGKKGKGGGGGGGSSAKKKDGAGAGHVEGGHAHAVGGTDGHPGNPEEGAFIPKKRTKKDYAAWAAATADYRAQSAAAYTQGASTPDGPGTPPNPSHMKEGPLAPKVPDGTRGFGMGRGRALPPAPA